MCVVCACVYVCLCVCDLWVSEFQCSFCCWQLNNRPQKSETKQKQKAFQNSLASSNKRVVVFVVFVVRGKQRQADGQALPKKESEQPRGHLFVLLLSVTAFGCVWLRFGGKAFCAAAAAWQASKHLISFGTHNKVVRLHQ